MRDEIKKDIIPSLVVFLVCMVLNLNFWMKAIAFLPLLFDALYFLGIVQPTEVYQPKHNPPYAAKSFNTEMFDEGHPILMPKILYLLEALLFYFFGVFIFFIPPVSHYFWNWGKVYWGMMSEASQSVPATPNRAQKKTGTRSETVYDVPFSEKKKEEVKPDLPDTKEARFKRVAASAIKQMERNHKELQSLQKSTEQTLDTMFEGAELTQNRFSRSIDEAVELSQDNLNNAKEYVEVGTNPELVSAYLKRSETILQSARNLLDALITHQQSRMEENLQNLTESLQELQTSVKYYK